jgi:adenine-specific DNA-methyltransferase
MEGGGYRLYRLGCNVFDADGNINPKIRFPHLAAHIWFCETKTALAQKKKSPLLGVHNDVAYYLLYNGILGDKTVNGGNVLTGKVLKDLPRHAGPKVIYGETCRLGAERLKKEKIVFKQTPYDVKAR